MDDCEFSPGCLFFNDKMSGKPTVLGMIKCGYCHNDFLNCARYLVRKQLGADKVPEDLFPHEKRRALEIIGQAAHSK